MPIIFLFNFLWPGSGAPRSSVNVCVGLCYNLPLDVSGTSVDLFRSVAVVLDEVTSTTDVDSSPKWVLSDNDLLASAVAAS